MRLPRPSAGGCAAVLLVACGGGAPRPLPPAGAGSPSAPEPECQRGIECDVVLPPPERGLQLSVGPFAVPSGSEVIRCFWRKVPADIDITKIELAYNRGSHHLDLYTTGYPMPDGEFDCSQPAAWGNWPSEVARGLPEDAGPPRLVVGFQNDSIVWELPQGVGYRLRKGQQLLVQAHYANAATQRTPTARGFDVVNLHAAPSPVEDLAETLFDEDEELSLAPGETYRRTRFCELPAEVTLIGMFGHFHSRGRRFRVWQWDPATRSDGALLYESTQWDDPPWYTNQAWEGPVRLRGLRMEAEYDNPEDREIRWGYEVDANEHMETYAMFYPSLDVLAGCICYHDGEKPEHIQHGRPELCASDRRGLRPTRTPGRQETSMTDPRFDDEKERLEQ